MKALPLSCLFLLPVAFASAQTPVVAPGGVVDAASFTAPVVPGSLVSIFGDDLAPVTVSASTVPLPLMLGGVSVTFNGIAAPLVFVSATDQRPASVGVCAIGSVNVVVVNGTSVSAPQFVQVPAARSSRCN